MGKIKNLSFRRAFLLYMTAALLCSYLLGTAVILKAQNVQQEIWRGYQEKKEESAELLRDGMDLHVIKDVVRPSSAEMSRRDALLSEVCDFLETWAYLIFSMAGCCGFAFLFYRNKILPPLKILTESSEKIRKNDLDFQVVYEKTDEMGSLCREFESMRAQLEKNNRRMWDMIEEEKILKAAIAHDIRSPLAVLRGYQEMLVEFSGQGALSMETAKQMGEESIGQIDRLEQFVETMRKLSALEHRTLQKEKISFFRLTQGMEKTAKMLAAAGEKEVLVRIKEEERDEVWADSQMLLEIWENLLNNGLRYGREHIQTEIFLKKDGTLCLTVQDDGKGFDSETLKGAFGHLQFSDDLKHFGLGLYLCRMYCEKHGGSLFLENKDQGGALVRAKLYVGKEGRI